MKNLIIIILFGIVMMMTLLTATERGDDNSGKYPRTVAYVDLSRYIGTWYEIAKIPNRFQKKCTGNTTAEYRIREDGKIDVINRCANSKGGFTIAGGIAKIADTGSNAKLKVSFVRVLGMQLFWGDYWIIGLDAEYKYAVVGDSGRKYGWILARERTLDESQWREIDRILSDQGYDRKRFVLTDHSINKEKK